MASIHAHKIDPTTKTHVFVVELRIARGSWNWGVPALLRTIRCNDEMGKKIIAGQVLKYRQKSIECIEEWKVDARFQGAHSNFRHTLDALKEELADHLPNPSAAVAGPLDDSQIMIEHIINEDAASIHNFLDEHPGTWGWLPRAAAWGLTEATSALLPYAGEVDLENAIRLAKAYGQADCVELLTMYGQKRKLAAEVATAAVSPAPSLTRLM